MPNSNKSPDSSYNSDVRPDTWPLYQYRFFRYESSSQEDRNEVLAVFTSFNNEVKELLPRANDVAKTHESLFSCYIKVFDYYASSGQAFNEFLDHYVGKILRKACHSSLDKVEIPHLIECLTFCSLYCLDGHSDYKVPRLFLGDFNDDGLWIQPLCDLAKFNNDTSVKHLTYVTLMLLIRDMTPADKYDVQAIVRQHGLAQMFWEDFRFFVRSILGPGSSPNSLYSNEVTEQPELDTRILTEKVVKGEKCMSARLYTIAYCFDAIKPNNLMAAAMTTGVDQLQLCCMLLDLFETAIHNEDAMLGFAAVNVMNICIPSNMVVRQLASADRLLTAYKDTRSMSPLFVALCSSFYHSIENSFSLFLAHLSRKGDSFLQRLVEDTLECVQKPGWFRGRFLWKHLTRRALHLVTYLVNYQPTLNIFRCCNGLNALKMGFLSLPLVLDTLQLGWKSLHTAERVSKNRESLFNTTETTDISNLYCVALAALFESELFYAYISHGVVDNQEKLIITNLDHFTPIPVSQERLFSRCSTLSQLNITGREWPFLADFLGRYASCENVAQYPSPSGKDASIDVHRLQSEAEWLDIVAALMHADACGATQNDAPLFKVLTVAALAPVARLHIVGALRFCRRSPPAFWGAPADGTSCMVPLDRITQILWPVIQMSHARLTSRSQALILRHSGENAGVYTFDQTLGNVAFLPLFNDVHVWHVLVRLLQPIESLSVDADNEHNYELILSNIRCRGLHLFFPMAFLNGILFDSCNNSFLTLLVDVVGLLVANDPFVRLAYAANRNINTDVFFDIDCVENHQQALLPRVHSILEKLCSDPFVLNQLVDTRHLRRCLEKLPRTKSMILRNLVDSMSDAETLQFTAKLRSHNLAVNHKNYPNNALSELLATTSRRRSKAMLTIDISELTTSDILEDLPSTSNVVNAPQIACTPPLATKRPLPAVHATTPAKQMRLATIATGPSKSALIDTIADYMSPCIQQKSRSSVTKAIAQRASGLAWDGNLKGVVKKEIGWRLETSTLVPFDAVDDVFSLNYLGRKSVLGEAANGPVLVCLRGDNLEVFDPTSRAYSLAQASIEDSYNFPGPTGNMSCASERSSLVTVFNERAVQVWNALPFASAEESATDLDMTAIWQTDNNEPMDYTYAEPLDQSSVVVSYYRAFNARPAHPDYLCHIMPEGAVFDVTRSLLAPSLKYVFDCTSVKNRSLLHLGSMSRLPRDFRFHQVIEHNANGHLFLSDHAVLFDTRQPSRYNSQVYELFDWSSRTGVTVHPDGRFFHLGPYLYDFRKPGQVLDYDTAFDNKSLMYTRSDVLGKVLVMADLNNGDGDEVRWSNWSSFGTTLDMMEADSIGVTGHQSHPAKTAFKMDQIIGIGVPADLDTVEMSKWERDGDGDPVRSMPVIFTTLLPEGERSAGQSRTMGYRFGDNSVDANNYCYCGTHGFDSYTEASAEDDNDDDDDDDDEDDVRVSSEFVYHSGTEDAGEGQDDQDDNGDDESVDGMIMMNTEEVSSSHQDDQPDDVEENSPESEDENSEDEAGGDEIVESESDSDGGEVTVSEAADTSSETNNDEEDGGAAPTSDENNEDSGSDREGEDANEGDGHNGGAGAADEPTSTRQMNNNVRDEILRELVMSSGGRVTLDGGRRVRLIVNVVSDDDGDGAEGQGSPHNVGGRTLSSDGSSVRHRDHDQGLTVTVPATSGQAATGDDQRDDDNADESALARWRGVLRRYNVMNPEYRRLATRDRQMRTRRRRIRRVRDVSRSIDLDSSSSDSDVLYSLSDTSNLQPPSNH